MSILFESTGDNDDDPELVTMTSSDELNFYGIAGLIQVFDELFLTIVTQVDQVGRCPQGNSIFNVKAVEFIPLSEDFK